MVSYPGTIAPCTDAASRPPSAPASVMASKAGTSVLKSAPTASSSEAKDSVPVSSSMRAASDAKNARWFFAWSSMPFVKFCARRNVTAAAPSSVWTPGAR